MIRRDFYGMQRAVALLACGISAAVGIQAAWVNAEDDPSSLRPTSEPAAFQAPVATFSILAVDLATGEIGVATQSKIVAVGAIVPFAKAGTGAVATQAYANAGYGPLGLLALDSGMAPAEAVALLVREDPLQDLRQVAVISPEGEVAVHTGDECHPWAGSLAGDHCIALGNILAGPEVLVEMVRAFETTEGALAERLLAALHAGQAAGGDRRGKQSAALRVVREGWGYGGIGDLFRDLRVDDSEAPIEALEEVYRKHRALFPRPDEGQDY